MEQAEFVLDTDEPSRPIADRSTSGLVEEAAVEVGAADLAYLAGAHELIESAKGLVDRDDEVGSVQLEHVDSVRAQPTEAQLGSTDDCGGTRPAGVAEAELGGDDNLVPLLSESPP